MGRQTVRKQQPAAKPRLAADLADLVQNLARGLFDSITQSCTTCASRPQVARKHDPAPVAFNAVRPWSVCA